MRSNKFLTPIGFTQEVVQRLVSGKTYRVKKSKTTDQPTETTPTAVVIEQEKQIKLLVPEYEILPPTAEFGALIVYNGAVYVYLNGWVSLNDQFQIPIYDELPSYPTQNETLCYHQGHLYFWNGESFLRCPLVYAHVGSTPPPTPLNGDLWYNSGVLYVYDSGWNPVVAVIEKGDELPPNATEGELFYKTDSGVMYVYHNGSWVPVRETGAGTQFPQRYDIGYLFYRTDEELLYVRINSGWVPINVSSSGVGITVGNEFPQNPTIGTLCYRTDRQTLYVYDGSQWQPSQRVAVGASFPTDTYNGMLFYHTAQKRIYVYHNNAWLKPETISYGTSFPPTPAVGELFFRTDENKLYVYNGGWVAWDSGVVSVFVGNQFPSNPQTGQIAYRTDINSIWVYDGTSWRTHERVAVGSSLPTGFEGRLFFNTSTNRLMVYANNQWREAIPPAPRETGAGTSFPSNPENGYLFYRTDENRLYVYISSSSAWVPTNLVNIVSSLPSSAQDGSLVFNSSNNTLYIRSGNQWRTTHGIRHVTSLPSSADYGAIVYNEAERTFYINTSDTSTPVWVRSETVSRGTSFPSSPLTGQVFFRTDQNKFYVYNGSWVDVSGGGVIPMVTAFPSNPATGYIVYRTDINSFWVYDGSTWRTSEYVSYGATLPSGFEGRVFYRTTDRRLYVFQNGSWRNVADLPYVIATDYATFSDAVSAALTQNKPLFVPRGNYTWNGITLSANTALLLIGQEGTTIDMTNVIWANSGCVFYAENINFQVVQRENKNKSFFVKQSTTGINGMFVLKNCSVTTDYTTDMNFFLMEAHADLVYLDEVRAEVGVLGTSDVGLRLLTGIMNSVVISDCKFIAPNSNSNTQIAANVWTFLRGAVVNSVFVNVKNALRPPSTGNSSLVIFRSTFEYVNENPLVYWTNVVAALDIGLNTIPIEAVVSQCSFYNRAEQKRTPIWAVFCRSPLKLVVTECYFENVVGIRTSALSDPRYFNPNNLSVMLVTNNVFRNCKGNAMELQTVDVMIVKDNELSCEGNFDLPSNVSYFSRDYGIGIRLRNYFIEHESAYPYEEPGIYRVCWVEGNKIKGYLKAGIWIETMNTQAKHKRIRYYVYNNLIERVNFEDTLSSTEYTRFMSSHPETNPFRGSGIVISNGETSSFADFTTVTSVETKGNRIYRCYHGIALHNSAIDGSTPNNEILLQNDTIFRTYIPANGNGWDFFLQQFTGSVLIKDAYFRSLSASHNTANSLRVNVVNCYLDQPNISANQNVVVRIANSVVRDSGGNMWNAGLIPFSSAPPASPFAGAMYYDTTSNKLMVYNGTTWIDVSSGYLHGFGTSFPANPNVGDLFYRTDQKRLFMWDGSQWLSQTGLPTAPTSNPINGEMYIDNSNNLLFVRIGGSWRRVGVENGSLTSIRNGNMVATGYGTNIERYAPLEHSHGFNIAPNKLDGNNNRRAIFTEGSQPLYAFHYGSEVSVVNNWYMANFSFNRPYRIDNKVVSTGQNDITLENIPNTSVRAYAFKVLATETTQTDFYFEQYLDFITTTVAFGSGTYYFVVRVFVRGVPNFTYRFTAHLLGYRFDDNVTLNVNTNQFSVTPSSSGFGIGNASVGFTLSTTVFPAFTFRLTRVRSQEAVGNRPDTCYVMPIVGFYFNG